MELRLQRDAELEAQRRANAVAREAKKVAAARRTSGALAAVRSRAAERQREIVSGGVGPGGGCAGAEA